MPSDCTAQTFHNHTTWPQGQEWGKKATEIQQGNVGSSNNCSKDIQDLPRIFAELEDSLMCALPHNPAEAREADELFQLFRTTSEARSSLLRRS